MIGIGKNLFKSNVKVVGGASTDPDAQAFITAAGITDATQKSAVNQLVLDLKGYSIWTKMKAIYPIVGGSASSHKWNLKDPRDLNAAFRLTFATGMTHSSTGFTSNGASGYANTNLIPLNVMTNNSTSFGIYSRSNLDGLGYDTGIQVAGSCVFALVTRYLNNYITDQYINTTNRISAANTDSRGFFQSIRTTSTVFKAYKNGTQIGTTNTSSSTGFSGTNIPFLICCINDSSTPRYYSTREYSFMYLGDGLTDTEAANFYTAVQNYQTTLGRNV